MAHFAKIENSLVTQVIVIGNDVCGEPTLSFPDTCAAGRAFIANTLKLDGLWKQCSYSSSFRGCYPGTGYTFDADADVFLAPQPFPSWILDENNDWQPPTPKPEGNYYWSEEDLEWVVI